MTSGKGEQTRHPLVQTNHSFPVIGTSTLQNTVMIPTLISVLKNVHVM